MSNSTVHILLHDLDADQMPEPEIAAILDADELARANRFTTARLRRRFSVGRAFLRRILADWTGRSAPDLVFAYGLNGKPALPDGPSFNLSHSGSALLLAIADSGAVGADIEVIRPIPDKKALAQRYFAQDEAALLADEPPETRDAAFLKLWTRKEALIKAVGTGLSMPLDSFSVSLSDSSRNVLLRLAPTSTSHCTWTVRPLPALCGKVAAVACDSSSIEIELTSTDAAISRA